MEMAAYRQGCTPKDAAAMLAVKEALENEKKARKKHLTERESDGADQARIGCKIPPISSMEKGDVSGDSSPASANLSDFKI